MLNPEMAPFLEEWERQMSMISADASLQERREAFEAISAEMRMPTPPTVEAEQIKWISSDATPVRVRLFKFRNDKAQPCLIYMHGGSWMLGSPETHWDIAAGLAAGAKLTVISVDYALAPEHPFPEALTQCAAVLEWAFENAEEIGIDKDRVAVGGDSAGGNLAAAIALKVRESQYRLSAQLLIYPAVDFELSRPSYRENADGPLITTADMPATIAMYLPDPADWENPLAAPLRAKDHSGLPPAYVAVAELDPLRDDGIAYAEALRAAGVPTVLHQAAGLPHAYLRATRYCSAARESLEKMCTWIEECNSTRQA